MEVVFREQSSVGLQRRVRTLERENAEKPGDEQNPVLNIRFLLYTYLLMQDHAEGGAGTVDVTDEYLTELGANGYGSLPNVEEDPEDDVLRVIPYLNA